MSPKKKSQGDKSGDFSWVPGDVSSEREKTSRKQLSQKANERREFAGQVEVGLSRLKRNSAIVLKNFRERLRHCVTIGGRDLKTIILKIN
ncbi:hypothetical protein TNCV_3787281 [Trichonephila clavipes]|nr:hypothetical protein TNCV_3787281 [Trichonephila clavipes]